MNTLSSAKYTKGQKSEIQVYFPDKRSNLSNLSKPDSKISREVHFLAVYAIFKPYYEISNIAHLLVTSNFIENWV